MAKATCLDPSRAWTLAAVAKLNADLQRSADTHLIPLDLPPFPKVHFYLKDESVHPSGSLKHRLARSLYNYALVNGWIGEGCTVIENSSGSTAVSEAYFAKLLGLKFIAVCPKTVSPQKIALIQRYGGEVHLAESAAVCEAECKALAASLAPHSHFMDQFTYAERATDYRAHNTIAETLFEQMSLEAYPEPSYVVCGAGTGGTSATLGRYVRYKGMHTSIVCADPENSVFLDYFVSGDAALTTTQPGRIEGIGRNRVEKSFLRGCVDAMVRVPDAFSMGAVLFLEEFLGRRVGSSTGTNFCAALTMALHMAADGVEGSIVAILCDGGERYAGTVYNREWRREKGLDEAVMRAKAAITNLCCNACTAPEEGGEGKAGGGAGGGAGSGAAASAGAGGSVGGSAGSKGCGWCPSPGELVLSSSSLARAAHDWPCSVVLKRDE